MNDELLLYLEDAEDHFKTAVHHLEKEFSKLRAGKASPELLDDVKVNYYGTETPLKQIANVSTSDTKTIVIQPWEKSAMEAVEKAILKANLNLTPINNGELIRINIPPLTEERRKQLVKQVKNHNETTKVSIRNKRRETMDEIKKLKKKGISEDEIEEAEEKIQKITDKYIAESDKVMEKKEKEIMTV